MQSHKQVSSHYREHTRQQDGWTVLALPPGADAGDEVPPPYTPEAAAQTVPDPIPAATTAPTVTLSFDIPINSNIIGVQPVTQTKNYSRDIPFAVGYGEICDVMGLDPATTSISFKWDNERANVPTHRLATAVDWENCLESGIGMMQRARTRKVVCMIRNLNLPTATAPTMHGGGPPTVVLGTSNKRKSGSGSGNSAGERQANFATFPPLTATIIQSIDDSGVFDGSPDLTFPPIIFADTLQDFQIKSVDQVVFLDSEFYVEQVHMPAPLAELFVEESIIAMGKADKGKGKCFV
ncbi:hypothetical protein C8R44DRAFT_878247 [Mycena epipterygia]|nr:hypothetical protein C8R44DRAFT_878247 [Mycena epipterygia]